MKDSLIIQNLHSVNAKGTGRILNFREGIFQKGIPFHGDGDNNRLLHSSFDIREVDGMSRGAAPESETLCVSGQLTT